MGKPKLSEDKGGSSAHSGVWEEQRLGDIAEVTMGQSPPSSSYNNESIGIPFVQGMADVVDGMLLPKRYTSKPTRVASVGDILLSVRTSVGKVIVTHQKVCIGTGFASIRANNNVSNEFLMQLLIHSEGLLMSLAKGSAFTTIRGDAIREIILPVPSYEEQQRIAECLQSVDKIILTGEQKIQFLNQYKRGLMQQLFPSSDEVIQ